MGLPAELPPESLRFLRRMVTDGCRDSANLQREIRRFSPTIVSALPATCGSAG